MFSSGVRFAAHGSAFDITSNAPTNYLPTRAAAATTYGLLPRSILAPLGSRGGCESLAHSRVFASSPCRSPQPPFLPRASIGSSSNGYPPRRDKERKNKRRPRPPPEYSSYHVEIIFCSQLICKLYSGDRVPAERVGTTERSDCVSTFTAGSSKQKKSFLFFKRTESRGNKGTEIFLFGHDTYILFFSLSLYSPLTPPNKNKVERQQQHCSSYLQIVDLRNFPFFGYFAFDISWNTDTQQQE